MAILFLFKSEIYLYCKIDSKIGGSLVHISGPVRQMLTSYLQLALEANLKLADALGMDMVGICLSQAMTHATAAAAEEAVPATHGTARFTDRR